MNKKARKILSFALTAVLSISCWEIGKKQYCYISNQREHAVLIREKEKTNIQKYLYDKEYDWINLSNTAIDYPLVIATDNQYYLTHNHEGKSSIAGAIYYDSSDEIYNGNLTVIYGHSMRDGTMFNNLHYFPKDIDRFNSSELTISTKEEDKKYKPLGFAIYNGNDSFYKQLDVIDTGSLKASLQYKCEYINNTEIRYDNHIIGLVTCDYSIDNGRLIVFYISE